MTNANLKQTNTMSLHAAIDINAPLKEIRAMLEEPTVLAQAGTLKWGSETHLFSAANQFRPDIVNLLLDYPAFHKEIGVVWSEDEDMTEVDMLEGIDNGYGYDPEVEVASMVRDGKTDLTVETWNAARYEALAKISAIKEMGSEVWYRRKVLTDLGGANVAKRLRERTLGR